MACFPYNGISDQLVGVSISFKERKPEGVSCAIYTLKRDQESIWDFPTPPKIEDDSSPIHVIFNGVLIARTFKAKRVIETGHAPEYYIPPEDIKMEYLIPGNVISECRWKGPLQYASVEVAEKMKDNAAWYLPTPLPEYLELENYVAFNAHLMDGCYVDGEKVIPDPLPPFRGWITRNVIGPFVTVPSELCSPTFGYLPAHHDSSTPVKGKTDFSHQGD